MSAGSPTAAARPSVLTLRGEARTMIPLLAAASALLYLFGFTLRWPLWWLYDQPYLDYTFLSRYTREGQAVYLGTFVALFALQYAAYRLLRPMASRRVPDGGSDELVATHPRPSMSLAPILGGQLLFGLLLAAIYPVAALDVYDYLMYGRIVLTYGANPFTQPPEAFPDPLVGFSPWPKEPSVYGPIWQLVSLVPTALSGGSLLGGLLLFKLTALGFYLGCTVVVWRLLDRLWPTFAPSGTLLFAWNPLLLFEIAGNAHNDAAMLLPVLLAILALVSGPRLLVLPLLATAVLTKLLAVALGPVMLVGLLLPAVPWRRKMLWVLGGGAIAILLAVAVYAPFWDGIRTLHFLTRGNWFTASFPTMLREYLRRSLEFEEAGRLTATLVALGFGLYVAGRLAYFWWRERPPRAELAGTDESDGTLPRSAREGWLTAAHDVTFVYLAFACIWWEPWYLTWLVGLAALLPSRLLHDRALLFCYGGVVNYVVFKYVWPVYQPMTYTQIMGISVVAIFGLPLLHLASTVGAGGPTRRRSTPEAALAGPEGTGTDPRAERL